MISEGVAVSRATQGAVRDPFGHWWVDYVATKPLQTRAEDGAGISAAVPLWQPHGWVFHRVCPAQPSRLTQQYRAERSVGQERQRRLPVYPASARTRGGTAPLFLWLPVIVAVRLLGGEGADPGTLLAGCNTQSLNEAGRGGASSGRDTTTRLFQGRQAPSLTFLLLLCLLAFVLCSLQSCVYKIINTVATHRFHTFDGERLFVPASLRYRSFKYHQQSGSSP